MHSRKSELTPLLASLRRTLRKERPGLNHGAIESALRDFLARRAIDPLAVPTKAEVATYLEGRMEQDGMQAACTAFAYLQIGASRLWGAEETSHFAVVLRSARVTPKRERQTEWARAAVAIARLPPEWAGLMAQHAETSQKGSPKARRITAWSASHTASVAAALVRWAAYCGTRESALIPTGSAFEAYARDLVDNGASERTATDYLARIYTGFKTVLDPGFASGACEFVIQDWRERGEAAGAPTKTAEQLVSARALYELGFALMDQGRARPTYGVHSARDFRNGLLLSVGIALPQRARALSVLALGSSMLLMEKPTIRVHIPGSALKLREDRKSRQSYDRTFNNPGLWEALDEYARVFRPLFDEGAALFPSMVARGAGISEHQIGRLTGNVTFRHFGVRVPIHRFRDNVATDASENMMHGGRLAPVLLNHRDAATAAKHYDHAEGTTSARDFGQLLESRRSHPVGLRL